jgi:hypothetical protein
MARLLSAPMNKKAAWQHACPFHNISRDAIATAAYHPVHAMHSHRRVLW